MQQIKHKQAVPLFSRLVKLLEFYIQRSKTRRQLLELDEAALKDIGLTRQQAVRETKLYFWQGAQTPWWTDPESVVRSRKQGSIDLFDR